MVNVFSNSFQYFYMKVQYMKYCTKTYRYIEVLQCLSVVIRAVNIETIGIICLANLESAKECHQSINQSNLFTRKYYKNQKKERDTGFILYVLEVLSTVIFKYSYIYFMSKSWPILLHCKAHIQIWVFKTFFHHLNTVCSRYLVHIY